MKYIKSEAGQQAFKDRTLLTPRQRSAFIQFDGRRSLDEVLQATAGLGVTLADLEQLVERGLLTLADETPAQAPAAAGGVQRAVVPAEPAGAATANERYKRAYPLAAQLTGALGLRGFRLNLAVEGAANAEDLIALLPKIKEAVGSQKCGPLEQALSA